MAEQTPDQNQVPASQPPTEPMSRRGFLARLGGAVGVVSGLGAGQVAEAAGGSPERLLTPEQVLFERMQALGQKIRELHHSPNARVNSYQLTDVSRVVFDAIVRKIVDRPPTQDVHWSYGDRELFFSDSRFKGPTGEVRQQNQVIMPNVYQEAEFGAILQGVPDGEMVVYPFMPYSSADRKYSDNFGSVVGWMLSASLPADHFLFVFSHQKDGRWVQQGVDAFRAEVEGKKIIFWSLEMPNPFAVTRREESPKEPHFQQILGGGLVYDQMAVFVTDVDGRPLVKKMVDEPHGYPAPGRPPKPEPSEIHPPVAA